MSDATEHVRAALDELPLIRSERDILEAAARGESYDDIADARDVTYTTLKKQVQIICMKLKARNLVDAARIVLVRALERAATPTNV